MLNQVLIFDQIVTNFLRNILPYTYFLDLFFNFFSQKGYALAIWITIIIVLIVLEESKKPDIQKSDKKFIIYFFISFLTTAFLVNFVIKNVVQRPRPILLNVNCPSDYSFPSGHAATAFAAAAVLSAFDKKRKYFYYLVALLIAFSRIYLGCHYFFDVAVGAIIGYAISKVVLAFNRKNLFRFMGKLLLTTIFHLII